MDARLTLEAVEAMVAETRRNAEALDGRPLRRPRPAPRRAPVGREPMGGVAMSFWRRRLAAAGRRRRTRRRQVRQLYPAVA
jgi:hypothetical protein